MLNRRQVIVLVSVVSTCALYLIACERPTTGSPSFKPRAYAWIVEAPPKERGDSALRSLVVLSSEAEKCFLSRLERWSGVWAQSSLADFPPVFSMGDKVAFLHGDLYTYRSPGWTLTEEAFFASAAYPLRSNELLLYNEASSTAELSVASLMQSGQTVVWNATATSNSLYSNVFHVNSLSPSKRYFFFFSRPRRIPGPYPFRIHVLDLQTMREVRFPTPVICDSQFSMAWNPWTSEDELLFSMHNGDAWEPMVLNPYERSLKRLAVPCHSGFTPTQVGKRIAVVESGPLRGTSHISIYSGTGEVKEERLEIPGHRVYGPMTFAGRDWMLYISSRGIRFRTHFYSRHHPQVPTVLADRANPWPSLSTSGRELLLVGCSHRRGIVISEFPIWPHRPPSYAEAGPLVHVDLISGATQILLERCVTAGWLRE